MQPELIVKLEKNQSLPAWMDVAAPSLPGQVPGLDRPGAEADPLHELLLAERITLWPQHRPAVAPIAAPRFADEGRPDRRSDAYWSVHADHGKNGGRTDPGRLEDLRLKLSRTPTVSASFIVPSPEVWSPASAPDAAAPGATPDFTPLQRYLDAAPTGIDARHAWALDGGRGSGIGIIDVEGDWLLSHENLVGVTDARRNLLPDAGTDWAGSHDTFLQHGTAVLGQLCGSGSGRGVTGIAGHAQVCVVSHMHADAQGRPWGPGAAISHATDLLNPGDIMLLEMHMPGPRFGFTLRDDQKGYIAVEWWENIFDAVLDATSKGIIVVEAGGNGAEDLDSSIYDNGQNFSAAWKNPFSTPDGHDSGAIVVGAGASFGAAPAAARVRLPFSNFGKRLNAQGWGNNVVTCGYSDLQGGADQAGWYTRTFAGTSSASPIVAGALACVQGVLKHRGLNLLTPAAARELLRTTGSPQQWAGAARSDTIGNLPDIKAMLSKLTVNV